MPYLSQEQPQCCGHAPGEHWLPQVQLQQAEFALAVAGTAATVPAQHVAVVDATADLSQAHPQCCGHAPGEHLSPHLQSQQVVLALTGTGFAAESPAKLIAVRVNNSAEVRTKSVFMFRFEKMRFFIKNNPLLKNVKAASANTAAI